jgi:hypothetical protein
MARRPGGGRFILPVLYIPKTLAGSNTLWWAKFHGCREVLEMVRPGESGKKG